ncbi:MAG: hypothetical protein ACOY46_12405 [Bacillota bacterium]
MTAKERRDTITDDCPRQEVDVQEGCGPCGATACEAEEEAGCCEPCE